MQFEISLHALEFYSYHGVMDEERILGNRYIVNLSVWFDINPDLIDKDDIDCTVSYSDLYEIVKTEMGIPSRLLETVAFRISSSIKKRFEIIKGRIEIEKRQTPVSGMIGTASVALNF